MHLFSFSPHLFFSSSHSLSLWSSFFLSLARFWWSFFISLETFCTWFNFLLLLLLLARSLHSEDGGEMGRESRQQQLQQHHHHHLSRIHFTKREREKKRISLSLPWVRTNISIPWVNTSFSDSSASCLAAWLCQPAIWLSSGCRSRSSRSSRRKGIEHT